jgi:hypothetical protein
MYWEHLGEPTENCQSLMSVARHSLYRSAEGSTLEERWTRLFDGGHTLQRKDGFAEPRGSVSIRPLAAESESASSRLLRLTSAPTTA